jgi:hypothetical protein
MASSSKRKTTMAKRNREMKLLERRQEKQAKKAARKQAAADAAAPSEYDAQAPHGIDGPPA